VPRAPPPSGCVRAPPRQAATAAVSCRSGSSGAGRGALIRASRGASPRHDRVGRGGPAGAGALNSAAAAAARPHALAEDDVRPPAHQDWMSWQPRRRAAAARRHNCAGYKAHRSKVRKHNCREPRSVRTPSQDPVFRLFWVGASAATSHWVLPSNATCHLSNRFSVSLLSHRAQSFSPFPGIATWNKSTAPEVHWEGGGFNLSRTSPQGEISADPPRALAPSRDTILPSHCRCPRQTSASQLENSYHA